MTRRQLCAGTTIWMFAALLAVPALAQTGAPESQQTERVKNAATVFNEIMGAEDKAIPKAILDKAAAIAIFPDTLKGGFVVAAQRGRGVLIAKDASGWSAPAFMTLTGGSFGAQIGGQAADIVLVIMNRRGLENLISNNFKLGADAGVAAGPLGREAEASTDATMRAQILSYSRSRGLFAGVSLKGTVVKDDKDGNLAFYGLPLTARQIIVEHKGTAPPVADELKLAVSRYTK